MGTIDPSGSYATGGISIDKEDVFGMSNVDNIITCRAGWRFYYDNANEKLLVYTHENATNDQPSDGGADQQLDANEVMTSCPATPVIILGR